MDRLSLNEWRRAAKSKRLVKSITSRCRNIRGVSGVYAADLRHWMRASYCEHDIAIMALVGGIVGFPHLRRTNHEYLRQTPCVPRAASKRLLCHSQPWNVGSARYLQGLGFKALATTSSGYAHSIGYSDGDVTRDMVLAHCREIAQATDIPVNADFEGGYADDPDEVAANVRLCVDTGVAGLSIEDFTGNDANPLYDFDLAVKRVRAARDAIDKAGGDVIFTARTEGFIKNRPDLDETIRRLKAFADAGADCLYSPGIKTREQIAATIKAVAPKPINFLNSGAFGYTVSDLAALGVRRISVGGTTRARRDECFRRVGTANFAKKASSTASPASYRMPN